MEMVLRFPILILFITFTLVLLIQSSGSPTVELEAKALLNWKTSLINQNLDSWVFGADNKTGHCEWFGIRWNHGGRIIEIKLSNFSLNGTLNQLNFLSLPNLTRLELNLNYLEGKIPMTIGTHFKTQVLGFGSQTISLVWCLWRLVISLSSISFL
ncbi:hypothetical protein AMTRI_Chr10g2420 [Amborella trichopoda]